MGDQENIRELEEALKSSPKNAPLRKLLFKALMEQELFEKAESVCREGLRMTPENVDFSACLADAFCKQGKYGEAFVVLESAEANSEMTANMALSYAKLHMRTREMDKAGEMYHRAKELSPYVHDEELEALFSMSAPRRRKDDDEDKKIKITYDDDQEFNLSVEKPDINFSHVGGMEKVKDEISLKIILPMTNKEIYEAYGKKSGGGILLYGPPGCGKTYLAKATAGEIKADFISVGLHDIMDMYLGNSEKQLHSVFEQARKNSPCVLFFDEVDALGASRSDMKHSAGRHITNQFLSELDGVDSSNEGVLVLAATNAPWHLDSAFRRAGRFDRIIFVPPPDAKSQKDILEIHLQGKPSEKIDIDKVTKHAKDFSGADIKALVDTAVESKLLEAMKKGRPVPITTADLISAAKKLRPTAKEWFATAKNYAIYSNQEGVYDDILKYLGMK